MKVLLSNIPIEERETYSDYAFAAPRMPPLGLAYIAALLGKKKHKVKVIDCTIQGYTIKELKKEIKHFKPKIIGFSCNTITYNKAKETIISIKKEFPEIKIFLGGPHITALMTAVMKEIPELDIGVYGEGEYTVLELAEQKSLDEINGIMYRKDDRIITTPARELLKNLDNLAFPARNLLPDLKKYSSHPLRAMKGLMLSMVTSRGCPFGCHYCDQTVFGRRWRSHSVDYIFRELNSIDENISFISFEDDNFVLDKKRVREFCEKKIEQGYKFKWCCSMRLDSIEEGMIKLMKKSGCIILYLGIESGNQKMLDYINKRITLSLVKEKLKIVKKYKIQSYGSFILGLPKDTKETIEQTIKFALSLPLDGVSFNLFTPYPNTYLREEAKKYGKVSDNWADYSDHSPHAPFVPNGFTEEELLDIQKRAYRRFYMNPKYIITHFDRMLNWGFIKKSLHALKMFFK